MTASTAISRVYPKRKRAEVTYYDSFSDVDDLDTEYGESEIEEAPPPPTKVRLSLAYVSSTLKWPNISRNPKLPRLPIALDRFRRRRFSHSSHSQPSWETRSTAMLSPTSKNFSWSLELDSIDVSHRSQRQSKRERFVVATVFGLLLQTKSRTQSPLGCRNLCQTYSPLVAGSTMRHNQSFTAVMSLLLMIPLPFTHSSQASGPRTVLLWRNFKLLGGASAELIKR